MGSTFSNNQAQATHAMSFMLITTASFFVGATIGYIVERDIHRQEAIKAGVAEWTINPQTGERKFNFKKSITPTYTNIIQNNTQTLSTK